MEPVHGLSVRPARATFGMKYFKFLIAAGLSVPVNIGSRILFSYYVPFMVAIVLSHFVGMITAFISTRAFVFKSSRKSWVGELGRFTVVNIVSLAQTWIVSVAVLYIVIPHIGYTIMPELTAHVIGLATSSLTSFFGHRHYSFRERE